VGLNDDPIIECLIDENARSYPFRYSPEEHIELIPYRLPGYPQEGQYGATHAWTEVYLRGAGWRGFDPTENKLVGEKHISVAVAREQENAAPISGTWKGPADAFDSINVTVQVVAI
jgi:transglutaminase-like putative cysteine protease